MKDNFIFLENDIIEKNLMNLGQITFEVTDACNLKCKYCGYGEFYGHYDNRNNQKLSVNKAIKVLEYMEKYWTSSASLSHKKNTYISFYGGEPLLNMKFIKSIVQWVKSRKIINCNFIFTMTTNGILLKKYINFLVENNFKLLISLDGNDFNNSYRVNHKEENSFRAVYENILYVKNKYPVFYQKNLNFNSVLHNRNDVSELLDFFRTLLDKIPKISELNPMGIRKEKLEEFSLLYNNKRKNIERSPNRINLQKKLFMDAPAVSELCTFLHWHSGNVYKTYTDLLLNESKKKWLPTGTCLPFQKKIFITTSGKILPCERVSHEYYLGYVTEKEVVFDFEEIVRKYNEYYRKYISQCSRCCNNHTCKQCMFYNENLRKSAHCNSFEGEEFFEKYKERQYVFLSKNKHLYKKIMEEVLIH